MDRLDGRSDRGSRKRGMSLILGAAVLTTQIWGMGASPVLGSEEEAESETTVLTDSESGTYEGTTQFLTTDLYLDFDMSSVSLVVEEVYAQAGSVLSQGDRLLKLTEESYREALDYYEAAVIYAENALTDEELAYDQGTAEAEYALEMARALADQAEYVKTSNEAELEDTLEEHQEVMTELEEAMSEIEEGIADGSYGESSFSSSDDGAFGGSGSAGGTGGGSGQGTGTSQGESGKTEDQAQESMGQAGMSQEENGNRPQDGQEQTENGMNQENGENFPESESQQENGGGQQISESQEESGEGQPESDRLVEEEEGAGEADSGEQAQALAEELSELVTQRETLAARLAILNQEYNDFLSELYERSELSTENFCGTGTVLTGGTVDGGAQTETEEASRETPQTSPVAGLEGVETVKTSSSQEELPNETAVPETAAEAQTQAATEAQTQAVTEAQTQAATEAQIQAATEAQTQAATEAQTQAAEETQAAGGNADQGSSASNTDDILIEEETGQEVVSNSGQTLQKTAETDGTNTETDAQQSEEQTEETGEDAEIETETETLTDEEKLARLESLLVSMNELEAERAELYSQISRLDDQIFDRRTQYLELHYDEIEAKLQIAKNNLTTQSIEAKQTYENAMTNYTYAQQLYEIATNGLEDDLEAAQETLEDAQAALEEFDLLMEDETIYAEYGGTVTEIACSAGDIISDGETVMILTDNENVTMTVMVTQEDISQISIGDAAAVELTAYEGESFDAQVISIDSSTAMGSSAVNYEVTVQLTGDTEKVYSGMTGDVTFPIEAAENVLYVSNRALHQEGARSYVKVMDEDGTVTEVDVETGFSNGTDVEIVSGLTEGQTVLIESQVSE